MMNNELMGLGLIIGGFVTSYQSWRKNQLFNESRNWPSVKGRITRSMVVQEQSSQGSRFEDNYHTVEVYVPEIEYQYYVGQNLYQSNRVSLAGRGINSSILSLAERKVDKYPPGTVTDVYYDPRNPANACLEKGSAVTVIGGFIAAIALCLIGVYLLIGH